MVVRGDWARGPAPRKKSSFVPSPNRVDRISQAPQRQHPAPIPFSYRPPAPAPAPAPAYRAPAPAYIPPAPSFIPQATPQVYQPTNNFSVANTGGGGGFSPPPAPIEPPKPRFDMNSSNKEIGQVDSTFRDQEAAFLEALQKYIADNNADQSRVKRDTDVAEAGIGRNRNLGLTSLAEDFAARGLSNSGLFVDSRGKADQQYDRQLENVTNSEADSLRSLKFNRGKYEAENKANIQAAKRDALARLAASQSL